jgi:hypothetical protein
VREQKLKTLFMHVVKDRQHWPATAGSTRRLPDRNKIPDCEYVGWHRQEV